MGQWPFQRPLGAQNRYLAFLPSGPNERQCRSSELVTDKLKPFGTKPEDMMRTGELETSIVLHEALYPSLLQLTLLLIPHCLPGRPLALALRLGAWCKTGTPSRVGCLPVILYSHALLKNVLCKLNTPRNFACKLAQAMQPAA